MSDTSSETAVSIQQVKGPFVLIIFPGLVADFREQFKTIIKMDGVGKVSKGVLVIQSNFQHLRQALSMTPHIALKRTREIPSVRDRSADATSNRTYTIVTYRFRNPSPQQKKKAQRLIRKSLCVRLRPGVLLFPYLRLKESKKQLEEKRPLLDARSLCKELSDMGAEVHRWGRLKIMSLLSKKLVDEAIDKTLESELDCLISKLKALREYAKQSDDTTVKLKGRYGELAGRYQALKSRMKMIQQTWHRGGEWPLNGIYNLLLSTRKVIEANESRTH